MKPDLAPCQLPNYRPVLNLIVILKILEKKLAAWQLSSHLHRNIIHEMYQDLGLIAQE